MIGSFGGFGGMGLGALSGLGGFAPTPEQVQERLKAAGILSYTPPASVITPRPTPVATPKPVPVMPVGGAYTSIGPNLRSAYTPTAPIAPSPVGTPAKRGDKRAPGARRPVTTTPPTPVAPKPKPVLGSSAPPTLKSRAPTPAPVTPPDRVGKPVSGGEFIPETTAIAPKPVTPTTPERAPKSKTVAPTDYAGAPGMNYEGLGGAISNYKKKLKSGADYFEIDDVDLVGGYYDKNFTDILGKEAGVMSDLDLLGGEASIGGAQAPSERIRVDQNSYFEQVKPPEYLRDFSRGMRTSATQDDAVSAFSSIGELRNTPDVASGLSNHYGYEIKPVEQNLGRFGGNLKAHTSSSKEQLEEFHSLVEPILSEQLPYLQTVEGMTYQDALKAAYDRDPMLQAMYYKYGVNPLRYTKDGSEYLYDPFSFSEIRTIEVKDDNILKKILKAAPSIAAFFALGPAGASLAAATGATGATAAALAGAIQGAGSTALTGGNTDDILKSALTGGVGGYAKGLTANAANLSEAAAQSAFTLGGAADPALLEAANAAAKTADTFGKVVQGAKFVDAAIDGNIAGAAISAFGPKFTEAAMNKVGLDEKFLDGYNINQNDVVAGLVKTELELAKGTDFGDAIARGFGEYIMEGGALGPNNIKTPEFIKKIGDAIAEGGRMFDDVLLQPVKGFVEGTVEVLGDVAEPVVDVIEDVAGAVVEKAPLIEDAVKATGSAIEDVVKPIVEPIIDAAPVVEDAVRAVGSTVDDAILQPAKELVEDVVEAVPDVDIDLPKVDVDLPKVDLPRPSVSMPTPTFTPTRAPSSFIRTPGILQETGAELFDLGDREERRTSDDDITAFLASLAGGGMANGGAVRNSYGSLDELLRIVGGK